MLDIIKLIHRVVSTGQGSDELLYVPFSCSAYSVLNQILLEYILVDDTLTGLSTTSEEIKSAAGGNHGHVAEQGWGH